MVDRAVDVFWERGYAGTSTRDLTRELDLNPSSLYRAFGDKRLFYLRVLDRYAETEGAALRAAIDSGSGVRDGLRDWLYAAIDGLCDDPRKRGCLMVNSLTEVGGRDPEALMRSQAAFDAVRDALSVVLARARAVGEVAPDVEPSVGAELLLTVLLGLKVQGRAQADRERLRASVDMALRTLG